jgi:tRNA (pseudouridine54-N1)-methyltransferase
MKHFVYFSSSAATSGKALSKYSSGKEGGLMKAGRMDIAIHSLIQGVFLSHGFRKDVIFHFVFYGMPDPPKHIQIQVTDELGLNKKDVGKIIQKILYKGKKGEKTEVVPGCSVEKKSFLKVIEELREKEIECFILDKKGKSLREVKIPKNCAFILGDHEGLPKQEMKRLKKVLTPVSIGPHMYFASQTVAVVNNELDYRGI